jgi:hypothetical protein
MSFVDLLQLSPLALDRGDDCAMWTAAQLGVDLRTLIEQVWAEAAQDVLVSLRDEDGPVLPDMPFGDFLKQQRQHIATTGNHTQSPGSTSLTVGHDVMLSRRGVLRVTKHVRVHYSGSCIKHSFDLGEVCRTYSPDAATKITDPSTGVAASTWLLTCRFARKDIEAAVATASNRAKGKRKRKQQR